MRRVFWRVRFVVPADDQTGGGSESGETGFTPPNSQEELNALIGKRLARERERFADYDDLKQTVTSLQESQKTLTSELETLRDDRDAKLLDLARLSAALKHGLSSSDLDFIAGNDADEIEARAKALADRLRVPKTSEVTGHVGQTPSTPLDESRDIVNQLFSKYRS